MVVAGGDAVVIEQSGRVQGADDLLRDLWRDRHRAEELVEAEPDSKRELPGAALPDRLGRLDCEPAAVLHRTAVAIGAPIRHRGKELGHQIPVAGGDLAAVEARDLGVMGGLRVALDDARDVALLHCLSDPPVDNRGEIRRRDHGMGAIELSRAQVLGAEVGELGEELGAVSVDGVGESPEAGDDLLAIGIDQPDLRGARMDAARLDHDHPGATAGPLLQVGDVAIADQIVLLGRELGLMCRDADPIRDRDRPDLAGLPERVEADGHAELTDARPATLSCGLATRLTPTTRPKLTRCPVASDSAGR